MIRAPPLDPCSDMFRPPVNRLMKVLDRSFFQKTIPISAAQVNDNRRIASLQRELKQDILNLERLRPVQPALNGHGLKVLLLKPEIKAKDTSTWSKSLRDLVSADQIAVIPYNLHLGYDYWNYNDILSAILPEDFSEDFPSSFTTVGHIAQLNLRSHYLPYKTLIADILLDKNVAIRSVINKTDQVGSESEYRTFGYELLAGDPDMKAEAKNQNCIFRFDFSKVYWNTRLDTEHRRIVDQFQPGEAVCDVMAGVGPFAVPAGKKNVFVWANDLNPESFSSLQAAINTNKVDQFVRASQKDGRLFIRSATQTLLRANIEATLPLKSTRKRSSCSPSRLSISSSLQESPQPPRKLIAPKTFSHYVMNLPASALTFLPSFIGLYAGHETLFFPHTNTQLPLIHVYCFISTKGIATDGDDSAVAVRTQICSEIAAQLRYEEFGHAETVNDEQLLITDVRDVAPQKAMYCASFRLPAEVAFRQGAAL